MSVEPELLEILVCPETHQSLTPADSGLLERLNERIEAGTLRNRGGSPVSGELTAGLLREDGTLLYPVDDGIPVMLVEEAIEV